MLLPIGDINPCRRTPVVNWALIAVNVLVFAAFGLGEGYARFVSAWGFVPASFHGGAPHAVVTLFTSMFLHGDILHLVGNMLFLWICGDNVEDMLGGIGYLAFYLVSGLAAGFGHMAITSTPDVPCIGASGAISGVLGAYVVFFPHSRIKIFCFLEFIYWGVFTVAAIWAIGFWFLQQALLTLVSAGGGVAYGAHVGGFVLGLAVAGVLRAADVVRPPAVRMERYYERPRSPYDRGW